jgi:N-methylhydantoinase A
MSEPGGRYFVGADTGGTFTDFVALDVASGALASFKVPSVPGDPARAVEHGFRRLRDQLGVPPARVERFIFGTTVATNAIIERTGARTAFVTTRGTRDVLEIQRQWRDRLFDLYLKKPEPLVARRLRLEVDERVGADGSVVHLLEEGEIRRVVDAVLALGVEAVAVCLLFSFLDPAHERRIGAALAARAPELHVTLSSDICPEFREYERGCTTAMNAYVMPKIHRLAARLESRLAQDGCLAPLRIMQSNGGLMSAAQARAYPIHTLLSGPAGGVVAALEVARAAGVENVVTMDMGGTSLDICVVQRGRAPLSPEGRLNGLPVKVPQVDLHTIGAGGGSIARVIRGALKIGPDSAGAEPGPVCYGRGGTLPTSTDCALALGLIDPAYFLGGELVLDRERAEAAIAEHVVRPLGFTDVGEAALAVVRVQVANMVAGVRAVSVQRGLDPREFALLPFGGAGALYAGLLAEELGMTRILVPPEPGVLSALGMLMTDVKYAHGTTRLLDVADGRELEPVLRGLEARVAADMEADGIPPADVVIERWCDMRYRGQAYEVGVPVSTDGAGPIDVDALVRRFHDEHRRLYGTAAEGEPVELVTFRTVGTGRVRKASLPRLPEGGRAAAPKGERPVRLRPGRPPVRCPVFERATLGAGARLRGPAIVEERGATVVLFDGHGAEIDGHGNILIAVPPRTSTTGSAAP